MSWEEVKKIRPHHSARSARFANPYITIYKTGGGNRVHPIGTFLGRFCEKSKELLDYPARVNFLVDINSNLIGVKGSTTKGCRISLEGTATMSDVIGRLGKVVTGKFVGELKEGILIFDLNKSIKNPSWE